MYNQMQLCSPQSSQVFSVSGWKFASSRCCF